MRRLAELLRISGTALTAALVCFPMLLERCPRTPLRVLCIAAFEYLARLRGGTLGRQRRRAIAHACDFGSLRDQYYDEHKLDCAEYRSLRGALRRLAPEAATARYIQGVRKAERNRPIPSTGAPGGARAAAEYRAAVIHLSLQWLKDIAGVPIARASFQSMASLVCLVQMADDLLDWKEDQASRCPSYVTALLYDQPQGKAAGRLRFQADALLRRSTAAARQDPAAAPFAVAAAAAWAAVAALLKVRPPA